MNKTLKSLYKDVKKYGPETVISSFKYLDMHYSDPVLYYTTLYFRIFDIESMEIYLRNRPNCISRPPKDISMIYIKNFKSKFLYKMGIKRDYFIEKMDEAMDQHVDPPPNPDNEEHLNDYVEKKGMAEYKGEVKYTLSIYNEFCVMRNPEELIKKYKTFHQFYPVVFYMIIGYACYDIDALKIYLDEYHRERIEDAERFIEVSMIYVDNINGFEHREKIKDMMTSYIEQYEKLKKENEDRKKEKRKIYLDKIKNAVEFS